MDSPRKIAALPPANPSSLVLNKYALMARLSTLIISSAKTYAKTRPEKYTLIKYWPHPNAVKRDPISMTSALPQPKYSWDNVKAKPSPIKSLA